jgi:peroxiredoxin Q/BCP
MASRAQDKEQRQQERLARAAEEQRTARARRLAIRITAAIIGGIAVLAAVFLIANSGGSSSSSGAGQAGQYQFAVGKPGPGQKAPPIKLPSTSGGTFDLAAQRGKTVLLYFQEGLTCQPCWDQLKDLEPQMQSLKALGIDELATITSDPLDQLRQKAADEGLKTPVLSDSNLAVSNAYAANKYGMMGASRDGHTFIVVGPTGQIEWRADYGGPPDYTMFVPVPDLLADMQTGLLESGSRQAG